MDISLSWFDFSEVKVKWGQDHTKIKAGCQPKTFKTFILMVKPLKPLFFSEKPLFGITYLYF